jgi:hypothetical protein
MFILSLPTHTYIYKPQLPHNLEPILYITYVYTSTDHNSHFT